MSKTRISSELRQKVTEHFKRRCAYCQSQELISGMRFTVDHIEPEKLAGSSEFENLCLACWDCNLVKGARIAAIDPEQDALVQLFHPQRESWHEHFLWRQNGVIIGGKTPTGRATVHALSLNREVLIHARKLWIVVG